MKKWVSVYHPQSLMALNYHLEQLHRLRLVVVGALWMRVQLLPTVDAFPLPPKEADNRDAAYRWDFVRLMKV